MEKIIKHNSINKKSRHNNSRHQMNNKDNNIKIHIGSPYENEKNNLFVKGNSNVKNNDFLGNNHIQNKKELNEKIYGQLLKKERNFKSQEKISLIINNNGNSHITNYQCPPLIILENDGNTTNIVTVLQSLANIISFSNYYLEMKNFFNYNKEKMPMSFLFSNIIFHLFPKQKNYLKKYSLIEFHQGLIEINPIFNGNSTKDAIDFLIYLLNKLHEEAKIIKKNNELNNSLNAINSENWENYIKYIIENEDTIIFKAFGWINKEVEKCWGCNKDYITYKKFFTYDLDFKNVFNKALINNQNEISIIDCIKYANEKKNMYNVFCKNCNKKINFVKISEIFTSGKYFIFLIRGMNNKENLNIFLIS